jgi:hypothetical protein
MQAGRQFTVGRVDVRLFASSDSVLRAVKRAQHQDDKEGIGWRSTRFHFEPFRLPTRLSLDPNSSLQSERCISSVVWRSCPRSNTVNSWAGVAGGGPPAVENALWIRSTNVRSCVELDTRLDVCSITGNRSM